MKYISLSAMALAMAGLSFAFSEAHAAQIASPSGTVVLNAEGGRQRSGLFRHFQGQTCDFTF